MKNGLFLIAIILLLGDPTFLVAGESRDSMSQNNDKAVLLKIQKPKSNSAQKEIDINRRKKGKRPTPNKATR